ncbi:hypothetical protein SO802_026663 [Lithocarpus litseifolius]|uniref:RNase H type-1 domain-containing protein n=1 Tax=Lithocarpus litseifolius TaxID=425828 RepID=A0AAW2C1T8_9ROSI
MQLGAESVQHWLSNLLLRYKKLEQDMMDYQQAVFTFIWTIWTHKLSSPFFVSQSMGGHWDLIIKISGTKERRSGRSGLAYEAITPQGLTIFKGGASCAAAIAVEPTQEALVEAALIAKTFGFVRILFLSSRKGIVKACNLKCLNGRKDSTMVADIVALQQQNFVCKAVFVPRVIRSPLYRLASLATRNPGHHNWVHQTKHCSNDD